MAVIDWGHTKIARRQVSLECYLQLLKNENQQSDTAKVFKSIKCVTLKILIPNKKVLLTT